MITRLYANNFRCLVAFRAEFDSFGVLCGPNGAGKSSVFDALQLIRNLGTGDGLLGGEGEKETLSAFLGGEGASESERVRCSNKTPHPEPVEG